MEMIENISLWNKTGEDIDVRIKLIISYKEFRLYDDNAERFIAWKAEEASRELVIELRKIDEEEDE